ncbi:metallophosphoesterase [Paludisphaera mucosa]|uniref:Metallophosphoesterase n=1 Tax=Paludisphaera mucosa TaxID=3030827 RepID=A0ABT6FE56_9BACT|nr:metallophosphoesterase [Paludisphaera mucosa]MDG3005857.1 metallophosphoesterase [Paludisphaera mucosa]
MLTLPFYMAFAAGEMCLLVLAINIVHGMGWKVRGLEAGSIVSFLIIGLLSFETTRRWWFVPAADWPLCLQAGAVICCLASLVGLPLSTFARHARTVKGIGRKDRHVDLVGDGPRERFVGRGKHNWQLRLPGNEALDLTVHHWTVPIRKLPERLDGLSILHLTDLHFSHVYDRRYFEAVFDVASGCRADLVLITGDLIDDPTCIPWIAPLFERLPAAIGRYAILGNHDHGHDVDPINAAIRHAGFTVLDGEVETIDVMGSTLAIGGTCAPWGRTIADESVPAADFRLLLSHTPDIVYQAARQGWDYMLCGHNHGGQVQLPILGSILMPSRYSRRFEAGFYQIDPTLMYVSRGLGAKHPIRFGCPPEISHFTLRAEVGRRPPTIDVPPGKWTIAFENSDTMRLP